MRRGKNKAFPRCHIGTSLSLYYTRSHISMKTRLSDHKPPGLVKNEAAFVVPPGARAEKASQPRKRAVPAPQKGATVGGKGAQKA